MALRTRSGVFSRVLWTPEGWLWLIVSVDQRTVEAVRLLTGEVLWAHSCPGIGFTHLDADSAPDGSVLCAAQAFTASNTDPRNDKLVTINSAGVSETGLDCSGQEGAKVRWNGAAFVLYSKRGDGQYWRQEVGQVAKALPVLRGVNGELPATFLLDVAAGRALDGSQDVLRWADRDRFTTVAGLPMISATERGGVWFGQEASPADRMVGVDGVTPFLIHEGLGFYPRLEVSADSAEYAATWANEHGTVSAALMPPFPPYVPPVVVAPQPAPPPAPELPPVPPVVEPPAPVPVPVPEPEPAPTPPTPKKRPWWQKAIEIILAIVQSRRGRP